jgi:Cytidylate kinase-like family
MEPIPYQIGSPHAFVQQLLRRNAQRLKTAADLAPARQAPRRFTIALSREAGARAADIAHAIGTTLEWPVFDRELVESVASDLGLRSSLLDAVDEKQTNWIQETLESFRGSSAVSGTAYVKHLVTTLLSLGAHGECIIVGRGSAQVLPAATTLRVRLVAPLPERAAVIGQRFQIGLDEAQHRAKQIDNERVQFVESYFHKDSVDPHNYDLVLNVARVGVGGSAKIIIAALEALRTSTPDAVDSGA